MVSARSLYVVQNESTSAFFPSIGSPGRRPAAWPTGRRSAVQCSSSSTAWWPSAGLALAAQASFILFYRLVYARRA